MEQMNDEEKSLFFGRLKYLEATTHLFKHPSVVSEVRETNEHKAAYRVVSSLFTSCIAKYLYQ